MLAGDVLLAAQSSIMLLKLNVFICNLCICIAIHKKAVELMSCVYLVVNVQMIHVNPLYGSNFSSDGFV